MSCSPATRAVPSSQATSASKKDWLWQQVAQVAEGRGLGKPAVTRIPAPRFPRAPGGAAEGARTSASVQANEFSSQHATQ